MTDDFSIFWQNNERAHALFYDLLSRAEREAYDDDFLAALAAYREAGGTAAHADIFAAEYLLAQGEAANAALCGERAFRSLPVEPRLLDVLARAYDVLGRYADALVMQGRAAKLTGRPLTTNCPPALLTGEVLDRLSVAMGIPVRAPLCMSRLATGADGTLTQSGKGMFAGEFLPERSALPYYVAVYTDQGLHGAKAWQVGAVANAPGCAVFGGAIWSLTSSVLSVYRPV